MMYWKTLKFEERMLECKMALLKLENIYAGYEKQEVLHGVSVEINNGDLTAVIGPNGSGKSTLLKIIVGLLVQDSGELLFNGQSINRIPVHSRINKGISYLIQGGKIFPSLSVKENLEIGRQVTNGLQDKLEIDELLEMFSELKSLLNQRAGLLSGGERQMLALAMILLHKPSLLLLDEPSAGLSPKLVHKLFEKIKTIKELWKNGIILVEQNVRETLTIATSAHTLVNGNIAGSTNNPDDWLESSILDDYFIGNIN